MAHISQKLEVLQNGTRKILVRIYPYTIETNPPMAHISETEMLRRVQDTQKGQYTIITNSSIPHISQKLELLRTGTWNLLIHTQIHTPQKLIHLWHTSQELKWTGTRNTCAKDLIHNRNKFSCATNLIEAGHTLGTIEHAMAILNFNINYAETRILIYFEMYKEFKSSNRNVLNDVICL